MKRKKKNIARKREGDMDRDNATFIGFDAEIFMVTIFFPTKIFILADTHIQTKTFRWIVEIYIEPCELLCARKKKCVVSIALQISGVCVML